jgi:hypothetical protein
MLSSLLAISYLLNNFIIGDLKMTSLVHFEEVLKTRPAAEQIIKLTFCIVVKLQQ